MDQYECRSPTLVGFGNGELQKVEDIQFAGQHIVNYEESNMVFLQILYNLEHV